MTSTVAVSFFQLGHIAEIQNGQFASDNNNQLASSGYTPFYLFSTPLGRINNYALKSRTANAPPREMSAKLVFPALRMPKTTCRCVRWSFPDREN